jgi:DNA-binding transcriptional MerR regulator
MSEPAGSSETTPSGATARPAETSGYRAPQVCKIAGITYRQLDHWIRTDLVAPSLAEAHGSGSQRLFSYRDLVELKVIKSLLDGGLALQAVRKVITYLRDDLGGDLATANLVIAGSKSVVARSGEELVDLVRRGQGVLNIVPLGAVKDELDAQILQFSPTAAQPATADAPTGVAATGS